MADGAGNDTLSGTDRAAILLLTLGEDKASTVLKHLDATEVQKVGAAIAALKDTPREQIESVMKNFFYTADSKTSLGMGNQEYLKNVLHSALGEDNATNLMHQIAQVPGGDGLDALRYMDPRAVASIIQTEHPQLIAIVLSQLNPTQAARILSQLPDDDRHDIVLRIAQLEEIPQTALDELNDFVREQTQEQETVRSANVSGVRIAADLMNELDSKAEGEILQKVMHADQDLGQRLQDQMLVFDSLVGVDDRGIQAILREVATEDLVLALKGTDRELQDKIFRNMSRRAADILRDDLEAKGPVRLSDVETAQKAIMAIAQRLAEEGTIMLKSGGDDFV